MLDFLYQNAAIILLVLVMVIMHWKGMGCCGGGHQHGSSQRPEPDNRKESNS